MTLTTNQDGLLTLEGLVVANQEEVKKWLLHQENFSTETFGVHDSFTMYLGGRTLSLPDDQFEAVFYTNHVGILRKPVSDVGEKNHEVIGKFDYDFKNSKETYYSNVDRCICLDPLPDTGGNYCTRCSNSIKGEKKDGLGSSSELEEVVAELERELAKLEEKPMFFSGHLKGYKACISDLKIIIQTRKP